MAINSSRRRFRGKNPASASEEGFRAKVSLARNDPRGAKKPRGYRRRFDRERWERFRAERSVARTAKTIVLAPEPVLKARKKIAADTRVGRRGSGDGEGEGQGEMETVLAEDCTLAFLVAG